MGLLQILRPRTCGADRGSASRRIRYLWAAAVATVSAATKLIEDEVPDLLGTDGLVLSDGSSTRLVRQAENAGAHVLILPAIPSGSSSWLTPVHPTSRY